MDFIFIVSEQTKNSQNSIILCNRKTDLKYLPLTSFSVLLTAYVRKQSELFQLGIFHHYIFNSRLVQFQTQSFNNRFQNIYNNTFICGKTVFSLLIPLSVRKKYIINVGLSAPDIDHVIGHEISPYKNIHCKI